MLRNQTFWKEVILKKTVIQTAFLFLLVIGVSSCGTKDAGNNTENKMQASINKTSDGIENKENAKNVSSEKSVENDSKTLNPKTTSNKVESSHKKKTSKTKNDTASKTEKSKTKKKEEAFKTKENKKKNKKEDNEKNKKVKKESKTKDETPKKDENVSNTEGIPSQQEPEENSSQNNQAVETNEKTQALVITQVPEKTQVVNTATPVPQEEESFYGILMDYDCSDMTNPEEHELACMFMEECKASGYGLDILQKDGSYKFYMFDEKGQELTWQYMQHCTRVDGLYVRIWGTYKNGKIYVTKLKEE